MNNKLLFISIALLSTIALYLIFAHSVHLYVFLPFAVFILFIGLHLFMHMGMDHGEKHGYDNNKKNK